MAMLDPISPERHRFLVTLLQAIDPTADLVECRPDSATPTYRMIVRIARGATTVLYLPGPMVERAHAADPLADYMLRAMLRVGIQELEGLAATERRRRTHPVHRLRPADRDASEHPSSASPGPPPGIALALRSKHGPRPAGPVHHGADDRRHLDTSP
jgi:hypothetical protein